MSPRAGSGRVLATGLRFPEGPAVAEDGSLFVVELAGRRVTRVQPDGGSEVVATLGGSPNGSAFGPDGQLYVCNGGGRWAPEGSTGNQPGPADGQGTLQRVGPDSAHEVLLDGIDGVPLSAPNDLCFDPRGDLWFTDPVWPEAGAKPPPGSVCWASLDGRAVRCHTGLRFPNGLALTDDGSTLVVAESGTGKLHAFPVTGAGSLGEPVEYSDLGPGAIPDGMCFDASGRLLVAAHGAGALFVVPAGGGLPEDRVGLGDRDPTNCCFGGPDHRTVYVTQADSGTVVAFDWGRPGMVLFGDRDRRGGPR